MVVTSYQRACALTESRSTRILFAINPLLSVLFGAPLFFMLGYEDYDTSIFFEDTFLFFVINEPVTFLNEERTSIFTLLSLAS